MLEGDWEIASGSALADVWEKKYNVIAPFTIPEDWHIDRGFDWGSAKPFAVGYFAEATVTQVKLRSGKFYTSPSGTIFQIGEIYGNDPEDADPDKGSKISSREIGIRMKSYEDSVVWGHRIMAGPGDGQIFDENRSGTDETINDNILSGYNSEKATGEHKGYLNQHTEELFIRADKSKGSRKKGLELIRSYLKDAHDKVDEESGEVTPSEESGLIFFDTCRNTIRTLPTIPRDAHDPEDVDTEAPDHLFDVVKYRLASRRPKYQKLNFIGFNG